MKRNQWKTVFGIITVAVAMMMAVPLSATAFDLKDKTVTIHVPFGEGGGSDTLARVLQPQLQKMLPGNPTVLVLNKPGGGSINGANDFYKNGEPDGTELAVWSSSTLLPQALDSKLVKYDAAKMRAIFTMPRGALLFVNSKSAGIKDPNDIVGTIKTLQKKPLIFGTKSPTGIFILDMLALDLLGVDVKGIFGLSSSKSRQAFLRGETNVNTDSTIKWLQNKDQLSEKANAVALFTMGNVSTDGSVNRDPGTPDLPTLFEVMEKVHGNAPQEHGAAYKAYRTLLNNRTAISKILLLPKGTPDNIVNAYITAVKTCIKDPKVSKYIKKNAGEEPLSWGKDGETMIADATSIAPDARQYIDKLLQDKFQVSLE
jgi:tripartite-type tricarboxylate transporter receptor subunit TctC